MLLKVPAPPLTPVQVSECWLPAVHDAESLQGLLDYGALPHGKPWSEFELRQLVRRCDLPFPVHCWWCNGVLGACLTAYTASYDVAHK